MFTELSPKEFAELKDSDYELIDVRSIEEFEIVNIGGKLIPLDELSRRHQEIDNSKKTILLCHHGIRSMIACQMLASLDYDNLYNLTGGIDKIATDINNDLTRY